MTIITKEKRFLILSVIIITALCLNLAFFFKDDAITAIAQQFHFDEQDASILAIKKVMPSVVSIIVYDHQTTASIDLNSGQLATSTNRVQLGSGTGFLISSDGLIITNKHVVDIADTKTGEFRVILNSGKQYYAQLIGTDPINDLAVIKIFDKNLPAVTLGDSDKMEVGTTVIAIGNALGQYQNTATKGIVSGLGRSIIASDEAGNSESLDNIIQTDAEINPGNSGGPLVDLYGNIVGINTAVDQSGSSIGFALPINDAKPVITSIKTIGRIVRPMIGIRYIMLTPEIAQDRSLSVMSGALVTEGLDGSPAISPGSPAEKAGIKSGDIITEVNGIKIEGKKTLLSVVQKFKPGDKIGLKILRGGITLTKTVTLSEFK